MKRFRLTIFAWMLTAMTAVAQVRTVENRPYTDLRPFHFGIIVGTHFQDVELMNMGPQVTTFEDGSTVESLISADQDRWDMGFTVGVLGELRLSRHFQFRVAPTMYFGNRHLTFRNLKETNADGTPIEQHQDLKTVYIASALDLIFAAPRFNNHRPYLMAGLSPMINLSGRGDNYVRLRQYDVYAEIGIGCDFYLPFFKLRPELKFMFGLFNSLDPDNVGKLKDKNMIPYAKSVGEARTKIIALSFYFE
ncbi:MAG: PorT family protein [Prevotella sp.]|nr:PorT family protein [Prevotella sp.]MDY4039219.1 porin family protein [Prevotella sp.]